MNIVMLETGLSADALRVWEKRYGLPSPQRSSGGHRLYSEHDIQVIKWLQAKMKEGFSISLAVKMWKINFLDKNGQLKDIHPGLSANLDAANNESGQIDHYRNVWLKACMDFDVIGSENIVNQAVSIFPIEMVAQKVIQQGLAEIGQLWFENKATPQQEHFASAQAERRLNMLISGLPNPSRHETILIGCPAGENHTFPLLMINLLLRQRGFNVVYLGANVPADQLKATHSRTGIQLVIFGAQRLVSAATLAHTAQMIQSQGTPVAFGGLIFNQIPELASKIPGIFLGNDLSRVPEAVERMAFVRMRLNPGSFSEDKFSEIFSLIKMKRSVLEYVMNLYLTGIGLMEEYAHEISTQLLDTIQAALMLGDLEYMQPDLRWAKSLSKNRGFSENRYLDFIKNVAEMIKRESGLNNNVVSAWLSNYIDTPEAH